MSADAVVVGAGPAGAATAILLAEEGLSVVLIDRARFPRDKVCGEYLSPEGGRILDRLGALGAIEARGARPLRGMRILAPDGTLLVGDYPTGGPWHGIVRTLSRCAAESWTPRSSSVPARSASGSANVSAWSICSARAAASPASSPSPPSRGSRRRRTRARASRGRG